MRLPSLALLALAGPLAAQPAQLTPEALTRIKGATCYVKLSLVGGGSSGTGFLVKKDDKFGYAATNYHVIAPTTGKRGDGQALPVRSITVVFYSGSPSEWKAPAEVIARDPLRDLALVRFALPKGAKPLGEPFALPGARASETMPAYICGFPFGGDLAEADKNPEISIGPGFVSSLRYNDTGELHRVQINGALNPGNSGGPIVSTEGKLLGVAVTTITKDGVSNAGIGHAVPPHHVQEMMDGRVSDPLLLRSGGAVRAIAIVVDPFRRLKVGKGWIAPLGKADETRKSVDSVSGLPSAQSFPYAAEQHPRLGTVLVANFALAPQVGRVWVQSNWATADSKDKHSRARKSPVLTVVGNTLMPPDGHEGGEDDPSPGLFEGMPGVPAPPFGPGGPFGQDQVPPGRGAVPPRGFGPPNVPAPPFGPRFGPGAVPGGPGGATKGRRGPAPSPTPDPPAPFGNPAPPADPAPPTGTPPSGEEEEEQRPPASTPAPVQPEMSAPSPAPVRPPADEDEGLTGKTLALALGISFLVVVVLAGVGVAFLMAGQPAKKPKRRSRNWDDEDDDRPRRRR